MRKETFFLFRKREKTSAASLFLILFIGLFLRVYKLDQVPPGLNRDEASIGYTAYSVLKTGNDEYGNFLPLSIKSFGDWKLPLYVYLDIPFVALLGLNEFSVRLPSTLFGTLTVLVTYFLVKELFAKWEVRSQKLEKIPLRAAGLSVGDARQHLTSHVSLLTSFLLAISQWHLHFSRAAYEANIALFLTVLGVWLFLKGLKQSRFLVISSLVLGLTFYTYHGCHIFTPLLVLGLVIIFWRLVRKNKHLAVSAFIFFSLALSAYKMTLFEADVTKISGIGFFTDKVAIHTSIEKERLFHQDPNATLTRVLHNRPLFFTRTFFEQYLRGFSPEFLFIKGGGNPQHNIPDFGNLNLFLSIFLVMGGVYLTRNFSSSSALVLWWLFSSGVAPALTRDAPHSARMLSSLPMWQIVAALGIVAIVQWMTQLSNRLKKPTQLGFIFSFFAKAKKLAILPLIAFFLFFIFYFFSYLDQYFLHFPKKSSGVWNFGLKEVVFFAKENEFKYKKIVMARPSYSPYIFFLFYQKYDPEKFQKEAKRYLLTEEGFHHVKSFGKYQFVQKIDWDALEEGNLYIDWAESVPSSFIPIKTYYLLNGELIYKLVEG